jgi:hypothetical protein
MQRRLVTALVTTLSAAFSTPLGAADINSIQTLSQSEFRLLSEDLGAALSYKGLIPAEPLGITGFDLGLAVTGTRLKHTDLWRRASGGDSVPGTLPVPTLRLTKGLPLDIDIGAAFSAVPGTNLRYYGGELRWAFLPGGALTPAVAVRGALTRLTGVDQLDFDTRSLDVSVSKGLAMFTPYAGIGQVWVKSSPNGVPLLRGESFTQSKVFAGLNFNLAGGNLAIEVDNTGSTTSFGAKIGFRF